ncbi:MAG: LuxR C-terminal-related transcriptional regulator [Acetobacteraceae bacterium]
MSRDIDPRPAFSMRDYRRRHLGRPSRAFRHLQVQRQLNRARGMSRGLAVGLDHFQLAVFLVDRDSTVLEMNQAAAGLLRRPDCPLRYESRRLRTATSQTTGWLHASIGRAVEMIRGGEAHGPAMLRLPKADDSGMIGVMVAPVRRGDTLGLAVEPLALVFASDPADKMVLGDEALMRLLGLSAAEASVATSLVNGDSVEEIADRRTVSRETVRVQLESVLGKTDTHSQGQLIALVTRSLAMLRRG